MKLAEEQDTFCANEMLTTQILRMTSMASALPGEKAGSKKWINIST